MPARHPPTLSGWVLSIVFGFPLLAPPLMIVTTFAVVGGIAAIIPAFRLR
ncbi:hypothetical protein HL657_09055 [Methanoculleus sp. YWC-01]|uniref:Uncharacterized protein n=1 Tax=Methanoculleus nereidis TaxID=2735141 RepID=A0ABU3Z3C2_9EURY|nr:hypothetical protein [Methanoculleus sp. YWC-01]MDV4343307.1 hypothetical protein [Methanoculleus sp. YWC-01]